RQRHLARGRTARGADGRPAMMRAICGAGDSPALPRDGQANRLPHIALALLAALPLFAASKVNPPAVPQKPVSFRLDVESVFFRAGCNSGGCHGAAAGKDGFHLGLFGYDPAGDYYRLTQQLVGRHIDLAVPEQSLLLMKATGMVPHSGGRR